MKTLSYARVSTADQVDGYSLESQRERAAEYARFKQWPEPIHFSDDGISGRSQGRPGLLSLIAAVRPGDVVLAKDIYRIGRGKASQTLATIAEIEERGASLVLLDQNVDTSTAIGQLLLTMLAGFSALEVEQTRERSHYGKLQAARKGHWPLGNVPYGYARQDRRLIPHPEHAAHVRAAFQALNGRSLREAMALLNAQGVPNNTERGGRGVWNVPRLHDLLNNPAYVGRGQVKIGSQVIDVPTPALISEELWASARDRETTQGGVSKPALYPLTGHLRCPHGAPYGGTVAVGRAAGGADWRAYCLPWGAKRRYGCRCGQAEAGALEAQARELLAAILSDPSDPAHARVLTHPATYEPDPHEAERLEITAQLSNLATLQVRGHIDLDDYLRLRSELKAREAVLARADPVIPAPDLPALAQTAALIRVADATELSRLLDILRVRLVLTDRTRLEVVSVTQF